MTEDELLFQQYLTIEKGVSWEEGQIYRDAFFGGLAYARAKDGEVVKKIFEYAKQRIQQSDLRHVDRTAEVLVGLFEDLEENDLAEKLQIFYESIFDEE